MGRGLHSGFLRSVAEHPDRPALQLGADRVSYAALHEQVASVAATLQASHIADDTPLTAVIGQRTVAGFAGILGVLCSGHGYVPMLPTYPAGRLAGMLDRAEVGAVVVDAAGLRTLTEVLPRVKRSLTVLAVDTPVDAEMKAAFPTHTLVGPDGLRPASQWAEPDVASDDIAYLLFTSGSTGQPKGVMVAHRNIARFLDVVVQRYGLGPEDRFSHMFEVTFDLSLFDMFAAWEVGGCLCVPDGRQRLLPAGYVVDAGLTVWFSVPSTALLMQQTRTLGPGAFPNLRWSLFCGEALTAGVAQAWAQAAQNSTVENLYGPTELTLACTTHRCGADLATMAPSDVVPIGEPFDGMRVAVVDADLNAVPPGESGELIVAGPQVTLGYWRDCDKTEAGFVVPPGHTETFYRTGDRVVAEPGQPLRFLGRVDHQIKIRGYRVELGEIEAVLRREAAVDTAIALGWPLADGGGAQGVVAFIDDASVDTDALLDRAADQLPRYMVPREVRVIEAFPLNANGKVDRNALRAMLQ